MIRIFPYIDRGVLNNGLVFDFYQKCKYGKNSSCQKFCDEIPQGEIFACSNGCSVYKVDKDNVIAGIRVKGFYQSKKTDEDYFCPILTKDYFFSKVAVASENVIAKKTKDGEFQEKKEETKEKEKEGAENSTDIRLSGGFDLPNLVLHEIRKFNGSIKSTSESIIRMSQNDILIKEEIIKKAHTIYASSSLISTRLNLYDFDVNPEKITKERRNQIGVYKKFEKASYILAEEGRKKYVNIKHYGSSHSKILASQVFDLLPFLLIENAIKYSPQNQEVKVDFVDQNGFVNITIENLGPYIEPSEIVSIFDKGVRGACAQRVDASGFGLGLYLAKLICDMHWIEIDIYQGEKMEVSISGVRYANTVVKLKVDVQKSNQI